jgi:predicted secreted protein
MKSKTGTTNHFSIAALTVSTILIICHGTQAFQPWKSGHLVGNADPGDASHASITEQAITEFCAEQQFPQPYKNALVRIVNANGDTDFYEPGDSAAHFDCEDFSGGQIRLQRKLQEIQRRMQAGNVGEAQNALGQALHTIQDFYSHSNWVENNSDIFRGLGTLNGAPPGGVASGSTCRACSTYTGCSDNLTAYNWTSGYFNSVLLLGLGCSKPSGKCSHGGTFDLTRESSPQGGINKDGQSSPHGAYHLAAARQATVATKLFLQNVQAAITAPQVKKLLCGTTLYIGIATGGGNTTGDVGTILESVKDAAIAIVDSRLYTDEEPAQYVLATFNDQEVPPPFVTTDPFAFKAAIRSLSANGGGDCRQMAGGGMFEAVSAASSGGSLFLFTDADAKDPAMLREALELAAQKDIQVFIPVFGSCGFDGGGIDPVYEEAAEITGGQVFSLDETEAGRIAHLLDDVSRRKDINILSIRDSLGPTPFVYTVPIDNTVTAVTFSVSGDTSVTLTRPDGRTVNDRDPRVTITNLSRARLLSIANPATGNWQIRVSGSGDFSITVTGTSSFDLKSFNFVEDPGARAHEPGLFPIDGFPMAGRHNLVSAELTDGFASAQFELRTPAGATLQVLHLEQGTDVAQTVFVGRVIPPASPFLIYARGHTSSGASFQRVLPGTIMPQSVTVTAPSPVELTPGGSTFYTFQVHNLGSADTFHIEGADDKGFLTSITPANLSLIAGETGEVRARIHAPADAVPGTSNTLTVTATGGSGARNFDVVITNVRIPSYIVITSASPSEGGTTSGSGTFANGSTDTVNATSNAGYRFVSWTENDLVVSTSASYTFTGSSDRALVAHFVSVP